jgi:hypothetical protein
VQTQKIQQTHCSEQQHQEAAIVTPHAAIRDISGETDYHCAGTRVLNARLRFACYRNVFGQDQYDTYAGAFWTLPASWGSTEPGDWPEVPLIGDRDQISGETILSKLKTLGGAGMHSLLPVLGWISALDIAEKGWAISAQELSRLVGLDRGTVTSVARAMEPTGLVTAETLNRRGQRLLHWYVQQLHAWETPKSGYKLPHYFYFDHRIIHGGQWRVMRPVQRAAYLAVATQAHVHKEPPRDNYLVRELIAQHVPLSDLERCRSEAPRPNELRLACVSYADIARISGYSANAMKAAVRAFKHPALWPGVQNDPRVMEHTPLWVYPTPNGNSLLYHFRDHAPHWPWDVLNAGSGIRLNPSELAFGLLKALPLTQP